MRGLRFHVQCWSFLLVFLTCLIGEPLAAQIYLFGEVNCNFVNFSAPRLGDDSRVRKPKVNHLTNKMEPGKDLMLLHPLGSKEVLVPNAQGSIVDPYGSFDGKWVFYSKAYDQTNLKSHRAMAARSGSNVFKINPETQHIIQLTFQEWMPNTDVSYGSANLRNADMPVTNYFGNGMCTFGPSPYSMAS